MDSDHSPSDRPAPSRSLSSPPPPAHPAPTSRSQTTLPPIHHIHPGLPHASMQPPPHHPQPGPSYMHGATFPLSSPSSLGVRHVQDDSDHDSAAQGRHKQKRRRQALSCTECKRRKIKCDRANPCGPCVRRGEQSKCQWHIIEPMEKYVTRGEFEDLKARVQELEALVLRGPSTSSPSVSVSRRASISAMIPMTSGPPPEPVQGTAITPYQAYGVPSSYPLRPASPRSPLRGGEPPPPYHRPPNAAATTRSPTINYRPPLPVPSSSSNALARAAPPPPPPPHPAAHARSPASSPRSPPKPVSPSLSTLRSSAPRRSSLSLADLTTPYNTEPKQPPAGPAPPPPKNYSAQTTTMKAPPPGPRLRTSPPPPGPAPAQASPPRRIPIVDTRRRVPV